MFYQCPKCHSGRFVRIKPVHRYEPRQFLWLVWLAEIVSGYLVRCTHHGCGRVWVVTLDGVHEPADLAPQPRSSEPEGDDERPATPEPAPELAGAVRRFRP